MSKEFVNNTISLFGVSAFGLAGAAVFYGYWALRIAFLSTVANVEKFPVVLGAAIGLIAALLLSSAFSLVVCRKFRSSRAVSISYGFINLLWIVVFGGLIFGSVYARFRANTEFNDQCSSLLSGLKVADGFYAASGNQMCSSSCPCTADAQDWFEWSPDNSPLDDTINVGAKTTTKTTTNLTFVTSPGGYSNWTACPSSSNTLKLASNFKLPYADDIQMGLAALGGLESDFKCAGFCRRAKFYTFSDIAMGPPPQSCVTQIKSVLYKAEIYCLVFGIVFIITSLIGMIQAFRVGCAPKNSEFLQLIETH